MKRYYIFLFLIVPVILLALGGAHVAHGSPDYGPRQPKSIGYANQDLAELAARLGSIITFDRRGDTVWLDNFEDNVNKWEASYTGNGASVALSTTRALSGAKSCALTPGDVVGNRASIKKRTGALAPGKIGFSIADSINDLHSKHILEIEYYDGTNYHFAAVQYDIVNQVLQYQDSNEDFQTFASSVDFKENTSLFYNLKLVIDTVNSKYTRFITDSTEYDLSSYSYSHSSSSTTPQLVASFHAYNNSAANNTSYCDDARISQNE